MIIAIARRRSTHPVTIPTGTGRSLMVGRTWFVGDSGLAQAGCGSTAALQVMVDWTGLMYYVLELERPANKCLWVKLHTHRNRFGNGESISVQNWLAISGLTQPLAQKRGCNGSNMSKEILMKIARSNPAELHARQDRVHGRRGSAAPPSTPGLTAVVNTAAPHQTFDGGSAHTPLAQQMERIDPEQSSVGGVGRPKSTRTR